MGEVSHVRHIFASKNQADRLVVAVLRNNKRTIEAFWQDVKHVPA